ncbi:formyltetrahydrofolate deformylase [Amycolatopsis endophytica]|uniref:Formyltetrahydrofolate deformylase n=1 Tax=Amycolatopsis endophytica TaxID=860233 RepID=A0A853BB19_9PSEU|nr:formyltetrahydrofolate deformylase [Amycolatopsis endophytica]NYI91596.1 formyltetrahydrofolate deformylase [Amycolatopsis endophytica]
MSAVVLTLSCPDRPGIVRAVSTFVTGQDLNIVESHQFCERGAGRFYLRIAAETLTGQEPDVDTLRARFADVARSFGMDWRMDDAGRRPRVLIMVSKFGHCLNDLLYRVRTGQLHAEVVAVVSNHPDWRSLVEVAGIPFVHLPVEAASKADAEDKLLQIVEEQQVELVVLARYMQILSAQLCERLRGRVINIHHSMLPSFKGARPYHQAYDRGVKLVGATAHYATADLDEGPIIEQEVQRVDHAMDAAAVAALGRDTECLALARAVRYHLENRVLVHGHKTVVLK